MREEDSVLPISKKIGTAEPLVISRIQMSRCGLSKLSRHHFKANPSLVSGRLARSHGRAVQPAPGRRIVDQNCCRHEQRSAAVVISTGRARVDHESICATRWRLARFYVANAMINVAGTAQTDAAARAEGGAAERSAGHRPESAARPTDPAALNRPDPAVMARATGTRLVGSRAWTIDS